MIKQIWLSILCIVFLLGSIENSFAQSNNLKNPITLTNQKSKARPNKQKVKAKIKFINPKTLPKPFGYSHIVEVSNGRLVYISGQVALDPSGNIIGKDDFRAQTQQVFENIKSALQSSGASFKDVVKLTIFLTDISQLQKFREVRDLYVNTENPPASSLIEVRKLFRDELMIEIEAIAVLPE